MKAEEQTMVRVPKTQIARIDALAAQISRPGVALSRAAVLRRMIDLALERFERSPRDLLK